MRTGLVLSGGGIRGIAHLGILKALEELDIKIDIISGTSAGAIVGAFYAAGLSPDEILDIVIQINKYKFLRPALSRSGLLNIEILEKTFREHLPVHTFEELQKKLIVSATVLKNAKTRYFDSGDLVCPVLASSSIPIIFRPMTINDIKYIDGGVINNLPVEPLLGQCDFIIGALCNPIDEEFDNINYRNLIERVLLMVVNTNTYNRRTMCDIILEPPDLKKIHVLSFSRMLEIFNIGYYYTLEQKEDILGKINV